MILLQIYINIHIRYICEFVIGYRLSVIDYELSLLFLAELQSFCLRLLLLINKNKKKTPTSFGLVAFRT